MGLFPASFIHELRSRADIVRIVEERVPLKKAGVNLRGLCPFHSEKTPSFNVHPERAIFHCFGCGVGGDVFKFIELYDRVSFPEAVRALAQRVGLPIPEPENAERDTVAEAERETLLKAHEAAARYFTEALASISGARARKQLADRAVTMEMAERLGLGYAPPSRDGLKVSLLKEGFSLRALIRSGLVVQRDSGETRDRFRNRLIVPIRRDTGSVIAFGGRAMEADQQPKYLNSPETPIYSKGRVLYGLDLTKAAIRRLGYAVLVEGYFDFAQALQAGVAPVVASCGTALTGAQAQLLRRYASKTVLSFDPDAAGQGAAARSCELLVGEGFQVNVAVLPAGLDPDTFVRSRGGAAYVEKLRTSRPYLEYLLDRAAEDHDFRDDDSRREFLGKMLAVAARIPDAAARDQFADRLAHKARITEEVVRSEIRKAAVARRTRVEAGHELPSAGSFKPAEKGLIWALMRQPTDGSAALGALEESDLDGLRGRAILELARSLGDWPLEALPAALLERLNDREAELVTAIAAEPKPPAPAAECALALRRLRYERERAAVQREIARLQEQGEAQASEIDALWQRKKELLHRLEALGA